MRQIVLDTETTGLSPETGHRVIEIGCVELIDRKLTGNHFHFYLNPQRLVDAGAFRVHGISDEFLKDKPFFKDVVASFVEFIQGSELIIHNAPFDVGFLNSELSLVKWPKKLLHYVSVCDTLVMAREKHPGQRNSLDVLCKRYDIDNSNRELHGALLDAQILASVYLAMTGGQGSLFDNDAPVVQQAAMEKNSAPLSLSNTSPVYLATAEENQQHEEFVQFIIKKSGVNLWDEASAEVCTE